MYMLHSGEEYKHFFSTVGIIWGTGDILAGPQNFIRLFEISFQVCSCAQFRLR